MSQKNTKAVLVEIRDMLMELMATGDHDRLMRIRLAISLRIVNAMIAAQNAGKTVHRTIKTTRTRTK